MSSSVLLSGNSCVSNGRGGGAWNSSATWTGCDAGVPGNGDTATLSNGDTVTVPAGYHAIVGASGAAGNQHSAGGPVPALQCSAQNGNAILVVDGTLTFRGNVEQCTAVWQLLRLEWQRRWGVEFFGNLDRM